MVHGNAGIASVMPFALDSQIGGAGKLLQCDVRLNKSNVELRQCGNGKLNFAVAVGVGIRVGVGVEVEVANVAYV